MSRNDLYSSWRAERSAVRPSSGFTDGVMAKIRLNGRPLGANRARLRLLAAAAVVVAGALGALRIAALLCLAIGTVEEGV